MKGRRRAGALAGMAFACLTLAALVAGTTLAGNGEAKTAPAANCLSGSKDGKIKHVIYLQFDNVHWRRDNPNVPSDIEQMPHLLELHDAQRHVQHQRPHRPDLPHGRRDPEHADRALSRPARPGGLELLRLLHGRTARVGFSSTFKYWTDITDGGNPANNPPTPSADPNYNMVNNDPASLGGTGAARNAPAPWVPFTRAGCDVGNVGVANTVLENNTAIILRNRRRHDARRRRARRRRPTSRSRASRASSAGQTIVLENGTANVGARHDPERRHRRLGRHRRRPHRAARRRRTP